MTRAPGRGGASWAAGVTVTDSRWAPDDAARLVRHINSEENRYGVTPRGLRVEKYTRHWEGRGLTPADVETSVADMLAECDAVALDVLEIGRHLETFAAPRHDG